MNSYSIMDTIALALIFILIVPGVYGIELGGGASVSVAGASSAEGNSAVDPHGATAFLSSDGLINFNVIHWLEDQSGKRVEVGLTIIDGSSPTWDAKVFREGIENRPNMVVPTAKKISATEQLTISNAKEIRTYAKASNKEKDEAYANVDVLSGSLNGYSSFVEATKNSLTTNQKIDSATGNWYAQEYASDKEGRYASSLWSGAGSITNYDGTSTSEKNTKKVSAGAESLTGDMLLTTYATTDLNKPNFYSKTGVTVIKGEIKSFHNEAIAKNKEVIGSHKAQSFSGEKIGIGTWSVDGSGAVSSGYPEGNAATVTIDISKGSISPRTNNKANGANTESGFSGSTSASLRPSIISYILGLKSVKANQNIGHVEGTNAILAGAAYSRSSDAWNLWGWHNTQITSGTIDGYSNSANTHEELGGLVADTSQAVASSKGNSISINSMATNKEVDSTGAHVDLNDGSFSGSSNTETTQGKTDSSVDFIKAIGSTLEFQSYAQNKLRVNEANFGVNDPDFSQRKENPKYVDYGGAWFGVKTNNKELKGKIGSSATTDEVKLKIPDLPKTTKKAIMLEPYHQVFADTTIIDNKGLPKKAPDYKEVVYDPLLEKGYAVTRYTDSAVSPDRFIGLDKYNIVLISSHMTPNEIHLSRDNPRVEGAPIMIFGSNILSGILVDRLDYLNPPSDSLVLLDGCSSFKESEGGKPSSLASAVNKASLSGGYPIDIANYWASVYMGSLFDKMAKGETVRQANENVFTELYKSPDMENMDKAKLTLYGKNLDEVGGDFTL